MSDEIFLVSHCLFPESRVTFLIKKWGQTKALITGFIFILGFLSA